MLSTVMLLGFAVNREVREYLENYGVVEPRPPFRFTYWNFR
jgi:hypothetical protein